MPNYKPVIESIGAGSTSIPVEYEIGSAINLSYPNGTYDPSTSSYIDVGTATGKYYYNDGTYRQVWKLPTDTTIDPCDPNGTTWYVSGYSDPEDRIVYLGEDLTESLNNEYTGCCFDADGNFYPEPSLNQQRVTDFTFEGIQIDIFGKIGTASGIEYKDGCDIVSMATISRSETFTVTFTGMTPNIAEVAPFLDDDVTVTLERSDGVTEVATSTSGIITLSAVAPQTITVKIAGKFGKKLFPDETWEYYFEKNSEFTAVPEHENFEIPFNERKPDPNEYFEPFRIDKDNNTGNNLNDLSQEVPTGVSLLGYKQDVTEREAGTNPIDGTTEREGHVDIVFNFTVTSSIPGVTTIPWDLATTLSTGDYVTSGGSTYYVEVGGTPGQGTPGTPGDPNATPPVPPTSGTPADTGPSGSGFFVDESGMRYRYIPPEGLITSAGAGDFSTTLYVMNDYRIGAERFQELLNESDARRVK